MSIKVMTNVWDRCPQKAEPLVVMLALADWCNDQGQCWPSVETLAAKARITDRATYSILNRLELAGEIEIVAGRGRGNRSMYQLPRYAGKPERHSGIGAIEKPEPRSGYRAVKPESHAIKPERDDTENLNAAHVSLFNREPSLGTVSEPSGSIANDAMGAPASRVTPHASLCESTVNGNGAYQGAIEPDGSPGLPDVEGDPGTHVPDAPREDRAVFGELAAWMGFDLARLPGNVRGRLNKTGAALREAGFTADDVATARARWPESHWKGQKGQAPAWADIEEFMAQAAVMPSTRGLNADAIF